MWYFTICGTLPIKPHLSLKLTWATEQSKVMLATEQSKVMQLRNKISAHTDHNNNYNSWVQEGSQLLLYRLLQGVNTSTVLSVTILANMTKNILKSSRNVMRK